LRFSRYSIIVIVIGALLVIMAPIWKWAIGPQFVKLPTDLDTSFSYNGTLKVYANPQTMTLLPAGQEQVTRLKITGSEKAVPSKSSSGVVVFQEKVVIKDAATGKILALGWEKTYALDRKTSQNVNGHSSDISREDLTVTFPIGTEKRSYLLWDDDTRSSSEAKFVKEQTIDGVDHKGVKVYVYQLSVGPDEMRNPPAGGLPSQMSGSQVKKILNNPDVPIPDDMKIPIAYFKKTLNTIVVEPRTGVKVGGKVHMEYSVNTAIAGPLSYKTIAVIDYGQTPGSVKTAIDGSAKYFGLMDLDMTWTPLFSLVVGLIMVVVGLFLRRRPEHVKLDG
jgi:Porin PorA